MKKYKHLLSYRNQTLSRELIILEPWAEQFWVEAGQQVDIVGESDEPESKFELVKTTDALTVWGWTGAILFVMQDGKEMKPAAQVF